MKSEASQLFYRNLYSCSKLRRSFGEFESRPPTNHPQVSTSTSGSDVQVPDSPPVVHLPGTMASPSGTLPSSSTPTAIPTNTIVPEEPSTFLSFPSSSRIEEPEPQLKDPSQEKKKKQLLKDRLYVGNLHPTVDECVLHPIVLLRQPKDFSGTHCSRSSGSMGRSPPSITCSTRLAHPKASHGGLPL